MTDEQTEPEFTAEKLIEMLKGGDSVAKTRAMDELFPGESTLLVRIEASGNMTMASGDAVDRHRAFAGLTWAASFVGNLLGMSLQWGPTDKKSGNKLVIAGPGGPMPMMR